MWTLNAGSEGKREREKKLADVAAWTNDALRKLWQVGCKLCCGYSTPVSAHTVHSKRSGCHLKSTDIPFLRGKVRERRGRYTLRAKNGPFRIISLHPLPPSLTLPPKRCLAIIIPPLSPNMSENWTVKYGAPSPLSVSFTRIPPPDLISLQRKKMKAASC